MLNTTAPGLGKASLQVIAVGLDPTSLATIRATMASEAGVCVSAYQDRTHVLNDVQLPSKLRGAEGVVYVVDFGNGEDIDTQMVGEMQSLFKGHNTLIAVSSGAEPVLILEAMRGWLQRVPH